MTKYIVATHSITYKYVQADSPEQAKEIALESLNIAADICIYTNHNIISETIEL